MSRLTRLSRWGRGRHLILPAMIIGLVAAPWAVAASGGSIIGGKRNPTSSGSAVYTRETQIIGNIAQGAGGVAKNTGGYTTRQSNKSTSGGGAIYGCRAKAGKNSCVAAVNLSDGSAFSFVAGDKSPSVGEMRLGSDKSKLVDAPPFITNGTGLVKNLNADMVGGKHLADLGTTSFAVVDSSGKLGNTRGATGATQSGATPPTYTVSFDKDVSKCAYTASPTSTTAGTLAVAPGSSNTNVVVTESATASGFHLQVAC